MERKLPVEFGKTYTFQVPEGARSVGMQGEKHLRRDSSPVVFLWVNVEAEWDAARLHTIVVESVPAGFPCAREVFLGEFEDVTGAKWDFYASR